VGRNPPAETARTFDRERFSAHRFAVSRLVLRVSGASSFLLASALRVTSRPCDLPVAKARDASDRLLPPERYCVYPYLGCSRLTPRLSPRAAPRSLGLRTAYQGTGCFTTPENASADCKLDTLPCLSSNAFSSAEQERGSLLPTAPTAIEPLTPPSHLPLPPECGAPSRFRLASSSSELLLSRVRKPPRLP